MAESTLAVLERTAEIEAVYSSQAAGMCRALTLYVRDPEIARDAVAEAFAQALAHYDAIHSPSRWVWTVAFREANAQLAQLRRESDSSLHLSGQASDSFLELWDALGRLPKRQRAATVLHYFGGYKLREIAQILDSSTAAVGVHLHRARRRLRSVLEEEEQ